MPIHKQLCLPVPAGPVAFPESRRLPTIVREGVAGLFRAFEKQPVPETPLLSSQHVTLHELQPEARFRINLAPLKRVEHYLSVR
jgi:hypothetical protein